MNGPLSKFVLFHFTGLKNWQDMPFLMWLLYHLAQYIFLKKIFEKGQVSLTQGDSIFCKGGFPGHELGNEKYLRRRSTWSQNLRGLWIFRRTIDWPNSALRSSTTILPKKDWHLPKKIEISCFGDQEGARLQTTGSSRFMTSKILRQKFKNRDLFWLMV